MDYSSLHDLIACLEYGTKLNIGVVFLGKYGNEKLLLPHKKTIHATPVCEALKSADGGYPKCFRCRNAALKKAIQTRKAFGGFCINGIYEYTRPVTEGTDVVCVIFIGNILPDKSDAEKIRKRLSAQEHLLDTMEQSFGFEQCEKTAMLIESYIRILLSAYPQDHTKFNPVIENLKSFIEANLEYEVPIAELAKIFHFNEKYLGRLFKKETGMSIREYSNTKRLERAKHLLETSDDTVISISNQVGFNNVTYFNRIFRKYFLMPPTEYRKKH